MKSEIRLKKQTLYYRDDAKCGFCGEELTLNSITYEHLQPKSKGGKHEWTNVLAACQKCNTKKGNSEPIGKWKPKKQPYKPSYFDMLEARKRYPIIVHHESWIQYLPGFSSIIVKGTPEYEDFIK